MTDQATPPQPQPAVQRTRCQQMLLDTFDQIQKITGGGLVTSSSFAGRSISYDTPKLKDLLSLYKRLHDQCNSSLPEEDQLPDLTPQRGRAARVVFR